MSAFTARIGFLAFALTVTIIANFAKADDEKPAEEKTAEKVEEKVSPPLFPDKNLEAVVRKYVFEKRDNQEPLTEEDVENISTVEGKGQGIRDLRGMEKCHSLALLDIEDNDVADIDPIMDLTNLQSVNLAKNRIGDLTALSKLTGLQYLHLANNRVTDLDPLSAMENMRSLYLSNNRIKNVTPLAKLTKLWSLYLDDNRVTDLSPLSGLRWLSSLDLAGNGINDIKPLSGLTEFKYLFLDDNQLGDISLLVEMAKKDAEGDQRFSPFWNVYLHGNPLTDEAKTQQVDQLKELHGRIFVDPRPGRHSTTESGSDENPEKTGNDNENGEGEDNANA